MGSLDLGETGANVLRHVVKAPGLVPEPAIVLHQVVEALSVKVTLQSPCHAPTTHAQVSFIMYCRIEN